MASKQTVWLPFSHSPPAQNTNLPPPSLNDVTNPIIFPQHKNYFFRFVRFTFPFGDFRFIVLMNECKNCIFLQLC